MEQFSLFVHFFLRYIRECYVFNNTIFLTRLKEVNRYYTHNYHYAAFLRWSTHRFSHAQIHNSYEKDSTKVFFVIMTFGTRHFIGSSKMTILNYDNEF